MGTARPLLIGRPLTLCVKGLAVLLLLAVPACRDGHQGDATAPPADRPYVAAEGSAVFHVRDCPHARRIRPARARWFRTREEAVEVGLSPCRACRPRRRRAM